ncbi:MAG: hypothetical protein R8J85_06610 [Mariprofundales bacterium]
MKSEWGQVLIGGFFIFPLDDFNGVKVTPPDLASHLPHQLRLATLHYNCSKTGDIP